MDIDNTLNTCSVCHQPVLSTYYFCPNCGNKLNQAPLSTSFSAQIMLYAFSIILPMIVFIFITKWQGVRYLKSNDQKTRNIGIVACVLLAVSTIATIYLAYIFTQNMIQSSLAGINADMGF